MMASGQMLRMTAFISATYGSFRPKSVVNVIIRFVKLHPP